MKLRFWRLLVCLYEILVHNPKKMDIASFVPSEKKHLLCHVNPWLLSSPHSTSNLHLISHWVIVQMLHKCSYAVKHENMNFVFWFFNANCMDCYSVYRQMVGTVNMTVVFFWHSEDRASWYILIITLRCINFSNLFWNKTLHVSDSSFVHHQEFSTAHTAIVYVIQVLLTAC